VAHQPTWGLDIGAVAYVQEQLISARDAGAAVLLISDDLDEVLALGDRVAVMHAGHLGTLRLPGRWQWTREAIGLAMAGAGGRRTAPMSLENASPQFGTSHWCWRPGGRRRLHAAGQCAAGLVGRRAVAQTYGLLLKGGLRFGFCLSETLTRAIPTHADRTGGHGGLQGRLFNIGAEGQLYAGALAAVAVGGLHGGTGFDAAANALLFVLMMLAAAGRRPAAAGTGTAEGPAGRGRGGDHPAAELHRAAVGVDDARRTDEGSDSHGMAPERGAAG
jgi:energy-coupling factor transporter ATP-binding protein EcfA2